jgi:nitroreductase
MAQVSNAPDVIQAMNKVRQARQYRPDPVSEDVINELLEVARWTGSSRNTQPWHFIAITDKDILKQLSQLRTPINWVADAPLGIAIVLDGEKDVSEAYDEGRVTERLMVAAHVLGLGGGVAWYGDDDQQAKAKEILNIPAGKTARSVVALGYPKSVKDPRPNPSQPGRHPLSEVASRDRMGNKA